MLKIPQFALHYSENASIIQTNYSKNRTTIFGLLNNHLVDYPTPITLTYAWGLGSLAAIFLGLQLVSGLILTMHYAPHSALAFDILEHIMRDVNNGWLWRYIHANGASFFFAVVYLHIGRGLYYFSYVRNPVVWLSGMLIFSLMMATAFMGYVLPWGQMSFWGATVITNLFSAIPFIGQEIAFWLWGGFSVDNPTLNRFYTLHFLLPFVIAGVAGLHLILLHRPGSTNPLALFDLSNNKIPFFPYFYWKDLTGLLILAFFYGFFIFFTPDALGHPDNYIEGNPMITPTHIVPEWYFLPFYAILRSIPDKLGGVVLMAASIIILFIISYLNPISINKYSKKGLDMSFFLLRDNKFFHISIWFFFVTVSLLGWIGSQPVTPAIIILGQINTLVYFVWLVYFPIFSLLKLEEAADIIITISIIKKIIMLIVGTSMVPFEPNTAVPKKFYPLSLVFTIFFFVEKLDTTTSHVFVGIFGSIVAIYFVVYSAQKKTVQNNTGDLIFMVLLSLLPLCLLLKLPENWLQFYFLFELSSLSTAALIANRRYNPYSVSAGFTYYFTSVIVSIFMLVGIIFFYLDQRHLKILTPQNYNALQITPNFVIPDITINKNYRTYGTFCIIISLLIKIGVTPFHGWLISVNTGAPLHVIAYIQTIYKSFLFLILVLIVYNFVQIGFLPLDGQVFLIAIGIVTLAFCSIAALIQTNTKTFLAYLSNATIGFLLILIGLNEFLLAIYYLIFYILANIIFFSILLVMTKKYENTTQTLFLYLSDFKFAQQINVYYVVILIFILLFSAGLPPTVLFFLKIASYFAILQKTNFIILITILIMHLITAFLYLRLMKIMLFDVFAATKTNPKITFNGFAFDITIIFSCTLLLIFLSYNWYLMENLGQWLTT